MDPNVPAKKNDEERHLAVTPAFQAPQGKWVCEVEFQRKLYTATWSGAWEASHLPGFPNKYRSTVQETSVSDEFQRCWRQSTFLDYGSYAQVRISDEASRYPIMKLAHRGDPERYFINREFEFLRSFSAFDSGGLHMSGGEKVEINVGRQIIDGRADHLMLNGHPSFVHVICELTVQSGEAEFMNWVTEEGGLIFHDDSVVAVDSHRPMIMRYRKAEGLLMELPLALYRSEELHDAFRRNSHTVRVLSVGNI